MIVPIDMGIISPIMIVFCGVLMVVLRAGASRVFFDVVGTFQATRMMQDTEAAVTTMNAIVIDGLSGMEEAGAMVAEQMEKIVEATVPLSYELEKATIEFEKFVSEAEGARLANEVREVGLQFGFTANEALDAGARMAQLSSLIGENAVPAATEMALAFGLIGDMTPEAAMQKLINLQQQTGFLYGDNTKEAYNLLDAEAQVLQVREEMAKTLNILNKVEDNSAATMSKITGVMNEFASQAKLAGESISMMAAMSATLIEAGEEQGKGGRALRMIYARLGANTSGSADALRSMGVEVKNADGSLRALSDILADLDPIWKQMNSGQKQATAQIIAGNRHYVRFLKLAENYDRVLQLNNATFGEMGEVYNEAGEAVGFLNEMMKSNAVALDRARAELELVNAQLGDHFIPSVIASTEFQVEFNKQLLNMLQNMGALQGYMQGFFEFQQIMSQVFAPFFTAVINVKAMNVALMTQRQIMRSLSGERLVAITQSKAAQEKELANAKALSIALEKIRTQNIGLTLANQNKWIAQRKADTERRPIMEQETVQIKEMIAQVQNQTRVEKHLASVQKERRIYNKALSELEQFTQKRGIDLTKWATEQEKLHINTKDAVQRKIQAVRLAQEGLNYALQEELGLLDREAIRMARRKIDFSTAVVLDDAKTFSLRRNSYAMKSNTIDMEANTAALMRNSMMGMRVGMAFFVAEMAVMLFKDAIPGVTSESHAARIAMVLMMMGMVTMTIEMIYSTAATLQNTAAKGTNTKATYVQRAAIWSVTAALGAETAAAWSATTAFTIFTGIISGGAYLIAAIGIAHMVQKHFVPAMKDATDVSYDATDAWDDGASAAADFASALDFDVDFGFLDDGMSKMEDFNSAREEMFFGFKAGQVTGDLIKQVQQGGVENFIANTEIIMTNTFNGMTPEEVADEVIGQIARKSGEAGMNLSLS